METVSLKMFTTKPLNKQANNGGKMESFKNTELIQKRQRKRKETNKEL